MYPYILCDDLVIYKPIPKSSKYKLNVGEIIILNNPVKSAQLIIKRIYSINNQTINVRGDNEAASTDSRQFGVVDKRLVMGVAECVISRNQESKDAI